MKTDTTPIKDCPFCGASIPNGRWTMTNGYKEVHCICGVSASLATWNSPRAHEKREEKLMQCNYVNDAIAFGKEM